MSCGSKIIREAAHLMMRVLGVTNGPVQIQESLVNSELFHSEYHIGFCCTFSALQCLKTVDYLRVV